MLFFLWWSYTGRLTARKFWVWFSYISVARLADQPGASANFPAIKSTTGSHSCRLQKQFIMTLTGARENAQPIVSRQSNHLATHYLINICAQATRIFAQHNAQWHIKISITANFILTLLVLLFFFLHIKATLPSHSKKALGLCSLGLCKRSLGASVSVYNPKTCPG